MENVEAKCCLVIPAQRKVAECINRYDSSGLYQKLIETWDPLLHPPSLAQRPTKHQQPVPTGLGLFSLPNISTLYQLGLTGCVQATKHTRKGSHETKLAYKSGRRLQLKLVMKLTCLMKKLTERLSIFFIADKGLQFRYSI